MPDKPGSNKLNVVIYWHMHQPEYRDLRNGEFNQPWTYLHTIKDYVDMAAHLEKNPDARAVVNFAPVLLEQIDDYASQLDGYLNRGKALRDPLLSALAGPVLPTDRDKRLLLLKACMKANRERLVDRFEAFSKLVELAENAVDEPETLGYYSEQLFVDIVVWYHIAWMAETVRLSNPVIQNLTDKARNFSLHDRHLLIEIIFELISGVIQRYKTLYEQGVIEISMTPYAHPIVPLLIDLKSATEAMPDAELPLAASYPDGLNRSEWHIRKGIEVFKHYFGKEPAGCWPSEGSISEATVKLISDCGLQWLASGETVLRHSLASSKTEADECVHQRYQFDDNNIACFFRDDGLSDLIGFKYSDWHADDAVANLVHHLELIAKNCEDKPSSIVSIILDGENAWEYYPQNGYHFLSALYEQLSKHSAFQLTTYSEYLKSKPVITKLDKITAGSWVYGTFSTWIGEKDKNRAWDMLVEAKMAYDKVLSENSLSADELHLAQMQLATCESSDWFWWFGEYNSAEAVAAFDEQYRLHLANLYQLLKIEAPDYLSVAFSFGSGHPAMGGAMLPGQHS